MSFPARSITRSWKKWVASSGANSKWNVKIPTSTTCPSGRHSPRKIRPLSWNCSKRNRTTRSQLISTSIGQTHFSRRSRFRKHRMKRREKRGRQWSWPISASVNKSRKPRIFSNRLWVSRRNWRRRTRSSSSLSKPKLGHRWPSRQPLVKPIETQFRTWSMLAVSYQIQVSPRVAKAVRFKSMPPTRSGKAPTGSPKSQANLARSWRSQMMAARGSRLHPQGRTRIGRETEAKTRSLRGIEAKTTRSQRRSLSGSLKRRSQGSNERVEDWSSGGLYSWATTSTSKFEEQEVSAFLAFMTDYSYRLIWSRSCPRRTTIQEEANGKIGTNEFSLNVGNRV